MEDKELLDAFKSRMRIFHDVEDENLETILEGSIRAIKRLCGSDDLTEPSIKELVMERSRYVYNDSLEFFNENFLSELLSVSLEFYKPEDGESDGETNI